MAGAVEETVELVRYFRIWLHKVDPVFVDELVEQTSSSMTPPSQTSSHPLHNREINQNQDAELQNYLDYMKLLNIAKKREDNKHIPVNLDKMEQQLIDQVLITTNLSHTLEYTDIFVDKIYQPIVDSNNDSNLVKASTAYDAAFIMLLDDFRKGTMDSEKWCLLISIVTRSLRTVLYHDLKHLVEKNEDSSLQTLLERSRTERVIKTQTRGQIEDFLNLRASIDKESDYFDKKVLNTMISLLMVIGIDKF